MLRRGRGVCAFRRTDTICALQQIVVFVAYMPKAFDACVRGGGRVRTKDLPGNKWVPAVAGG
jgi:hypothetical protein